VDQQIDWHFFFFGDFLGWEKKGLGGCHLVLFGLVQVAGT
jgi:hypothetical protein